jgi:hypothetical protein
MLQNGLTSSFTARARGFLGNEFVLLGADGGERGRLKMPGLQGAELGAKDLEVTIERTADGRYEMLSGGEEVLSSRPAGASADKLEIRSGERTYTAAISFLRNKAVAHDKADNEAVRLAGNVTGRAYKVETDAEDPCALPVAVLLIYHTALNRRRAYRAAVRR